MCSRRPCSASHRLRSPSEKGHFWAPVASQVAILCREKAVPEDSNGRGRMGLWLLNSGRVSFAVFRKTARGRHSACPGGSAWPHVEPRRRGSRQVSCAATTVVPVSWVELHTADFGQRHRTTRLTAAGTAHWRRASSPGPSVPAARVACRGGRAAWCRFSEFLQACWQCQALFLFFKSPELYFFKRQNSY